VCRDFILFCVAKAKPSKKFLLFVEGSGLGAVVLVEPTAGVGGDGIVHEGLGGFLGT
jgi:hypothetical protein